MRLLKKILKWTFIIVGGLVAILLIANACFVWITDAQLERELAKIREAVDPVSLADIRPKSIPPDQNAATYLRRARDDLKAINSEIHAAAMAQPDTDFRTPKVIEATRSAVAAYPEVIPLLEKAADCPGYVLNESFGPAGASDPKAALEAYLIRVYENREVARLLGYYWPNLLLSEGKRDEAARSAIAMLRLTRHFDREPTLVSFLVAIACRGYSLEVLNEALQSGPISENVRKQLDDELARHDMKRAFYENLKTERAFGLDMCRTFPWGRFWFTRAYSNRLMLQYLAQMNWFLAKTSVDPKAARTLTSQPQCNNSVVTLVLSSLNAAENATNRMASTLNAIRVLNALQRRDDPDKLPAADLPDLGLPREATLDLFTGKPLIVKKVPGGWLIYSVGMDLKDDGGKISDDDYQDTGFGPPKPRPK